MKLEHYPIEELKREILDIVGKHVDLKKYKVFFFGSRVEGKGDDRSDIDIGIEGPQKIPFEIMARIKAETDNIYTLYLIDIVDFKRVDDKFKKVAKGYIEIISP